MVERSWRKEWRALIIRGMPELSYENQIAIRSTAKAVLALDNLVSALRASGRVRFRGRKVTKEAVVNAVWLWLADQSVDDVEQCLLTYVPRLEAILSGDATTTPAIPTILTNHPSVGVPVAVRDETAMQERTDKARRPPPKRGPRKKG